MINGIYTLRRVGTVSIERHALCATPDGRSNSALHRVDTVLSIMNVSTRPGGLEIRLPLLVKYVEAGWLGRKVAGFYDYRTEPPTPTPEAAARGLIDSAAGISALPLEQGPMSEIAVFSAAPTGFGAEIAPISVPCTSRLERSPATA